MHFFGTDLDLDDARFRRNHRRMERLVAIRFLESDIIFEFTRERLIERMDDAERRITIFNSRNNNTERCNIVDEADIIVFPLQFLMQAPETFYTDFCAGIFNIFLR